MSAEILAPAGSFEALTAAVRCGANAVYLGGKYFNARRNAANFSDEELEQAVRYCHERNVKVYLALNTLIGDGETETAYQAVKCACKANADALILQDLGLVSLVKQVCPSMPMHASTQMSVQTAEGIKELEKLGFVRAVLPRDLSEKEIKYISSQTNTELEAFVHGALCMCVSGQCLMSSVLGGRSGNRGLCAQPCRLEFGVNKKGGNNLSLKDLSLVRELKRLENAGVCSFKIEGRMKRPEYVAAAVTACANSLNGKIDEELDRSLQAVFSRSGFTKGYFEGKLGKDMFGYRRKEDVESAAPVLSGLRRLYDNENSLIPVDIFLLFKSGVPMKITASALGKTVEYASALVPQPALNRAMSENDLKERMSKCGGTQFFAGSVSIDFEEGLNASAGELNSMRRQALALLEKAISEKEPKPVKKFERKQNIHSAKELKTHIRFFSEEQIPDNLDGIDRVIIPLETSEETVRRLINGGTEVAAEIPAFVFSNAHIYNEKINIMKSCGVKLVAACNIDGIGIAKKAGMDFVSFFGMNIMNSLSLETIASMGAKDCLLSSEISASDMYRLGGDIPRGVMTYGRIPLMITRNCPVKNKLSCAECGAKSSLVDRMGVEFPVKCKNGGSYIFNSRPVYLADKLREIKNVDYQLLYFTVESREECERVIEAYKTGKNPEGEFTRGSYFKKIL